ncbi:TPA: hypothetical protein DIU27_02120 [Candidatus Collierbacteria bacterium]|nr:MAG: hypothetical protein UW88_C0001G0089 [Candidatus Collierbacteria bacterium GW2011_GWD2_45_10]HCQ31164.1 hypothetical protein [Candidatus Collierbacteria bacterium]
MVLIMTVISAVAVSVASRSTVETRIQEMDVENKEAVLTAQAGLEEAIARDVAVSGSLESGKDYNVVRGDVGSSSITTEKINPGETFEVYLSGASGVTGVKFYWKPVVVGEKPSLFITDVRGTGNIDYAYDTDGSGGFTAGITPGGSFSGVSYNFVTPTVPVSLGNSAKLRITVLGDSAFLGIRPIGGSFPAQSTNFKSTSTLVSGDTSVKYGIEYIESKTNQLPSVFDYVLFSGGTIVQ